MRELTDLEIEAVSGGENGDIIVNRRKNRAPETSLNSGDFDSKSLFDSGILGGDTTSINDVVEKAEDAGLDDKDGVESVQAWRSADPEAIAFDLSTARSNLEIAQRVAALATALGLAGAIAAWAQFKSVGIASVLRALGLNGEAAAAAGVGAFGVDAYLDAQESYWTDEISRLERLEQLYPIRR